MNISTKLVYWGQKHHVVSGIASRVLRYVFSCDISLPLKQLRGGLSIEHNGLGIVVSKEVSIGNNCRIYQHVTIGAGKDGYPVIGDNVTIYCNAVIVGKINIGNNVIIGANSFVNKDVPDNYVVGGVPARLLKENSGRSSTASDF